MSKDHHPADDALDEHEHFAFSSNYRDTFADGHRQSGEESSLPAADEEAIDSADLIDVLGAPREPLGGAGLASITPIEGVAAAVGREEFVESGGRASDARGTPEPTPREEDDRDPTGLSEQELRRRKRIGMAGMIVGGIVILGGLGSIIADQFRAAASKPVAGPFAVVASAPGADEAKATTNAPPPPAPSVTPMPAAVSTEPAQLVQHAAPQFGGQATPSVLPEPQQQVASVSAPSLPPEAIARVERIEARVDALAVDIGSIARRLDSVPTSKPPHAQQVSGTNQGRGGNDSKAGAQSQLTPNAAVVKPKLKTDPDLIEGYVVSATVKGQAWLRDDGGQAVVVQPGDWIRGAKVVAIDSKTDVVLTTSGPITSH